MTLRPDRAGWPFIGAFAVPAALLAACGCRRGALTFSALTGYMALFFRDPDRPCDTHCTDADTVIAPADGVVVVAGDPEPSPEYRMWSLRVLLVPAVLMVTSVKFRSFRSLVSPHGRPYPLIGFLLALAVGFATFPAITGCVLAYGYVALPVLSRLGQPVTRLRPSHAV